MKGFTKQRKAWAAPSCLATQQKPHTVQFAGRLWEGGMAAISPEATEDSYEMQVRRMMETVYMMMIIIRAANDPSVFTITEKNSVLVL